MRPLLRGLRRSPWGCFLLLLLVAWGLRWGLPLERHVFDGHERDYLRVFQGERLDSSTSLYPSMAALYRLLGALPGAHSGWLLGLNLFAGALAAACAGWALERELQQGRGWLAGLLFALTPEAVAWSASAYHVMLPLCLLCVGLALRGWLGGVCYALACTGRPELGLLSPVVLLLADRRTALGCLGLLLPWWQLEAAPPLHPPGAVWLANLQLFSLAGPLATPLGGLLLLPGLLLRARVVLPLLLAALWVHLVGSCFDDYGARHALLASLCLAAALCAGLEPGRPLLLGVLAAAGLGAQVFAYHQSLDRFYRHRLPDLELWEKGLPELSEAPDCHELQDDPRSPESHWGYRGSWPEGEVCWAEEAIHRSWSSRGLSDRALRMRVLYEPQPLAWRSLPGGPRVYHLLQSRP